MVKDISSDVLGEILDSGYEDQIIDIFMAMEGQDEFSVSDIPIAPSTLKDSHESVIISQQVYDKYRELVERISNSNTAEEIPFFLLGNSKVVDGRKFVEFSQIVVDMNNASSATTVEVDNNLFQRLLEDESYNAVSMGHTHGNVQEKLKDSSLTRALSEELRKQYNIRDVGLNLSVADLNQHEVVKASAERLGIQKAIYQTVIMYNGDMIIVSPDEIAKSENIRVKDRYDISIPCGKEQKDIEERDKGTVLLSKIYK